MMSGPLQNLIAVCITLTCVVTNTNIFNIVYCLDAPQIHVPGQGFIVGTYLKLFRTQNIKAYLGIPYAEAARFSPPEVGSLKWNGVLNATSFARDCWQKPFKAENKETEIVLQLLKTYVKPNKVQKTYDENCLHLNIFIPDGTQSQNGYAVIVWFNAGDFSYGSPLDIDPFLLVFKQKVIVVTFSYRLNIFGFLTSGDGEAQGNYGLMDQSAALFWIRKNINIFGGDENQITIMGHSAGAISVGLHLTSGDWSKNAFTKAIIMSGNPLTENVIKTSKEYHESLDTIANIFGCPRRPTSMLIICLKKIDAQTLVENLPIMEWGPVIDYGFSNKSFHFIEDYPIILFKKGNFHKVPILIGITDMEDVLSLVDEEMDVKISNEDFFIFIRDVALNDLKKAYNSDKECTNVHIVLDALNYIYQNQSNEQMLIKNVINFHTDRMYVAPLYLFADILSKSEQIYAYLFNVRPKSKFYELPDWMNVPKYFDQIFIWGTPYMNNNDFVKEWNSSDKKISDIVMTLWANFAKTSNPTISNVYVKWNPYDMNNQSLLVINENFTSNILNNIHITNFWNNYYPKVLEFTVDCCNVTNKANFIYLNIIFIKLISLLYIIYNY